ncbi:MAG TPA: hypothetical protein VGJ60_07200 [Chloroflexota bacterium]|jgi:hypothetical protein
MRTLRGRDLGQLLDPQPPSAEPLDCGCTLADPRTWCAVHADLLGEVLTAWTSGISWQRRAIWQEADGLGVRGHVPPGGRFDRTALERSTPPAVERMWRVCHDLGPLG